MPDSGDPEWQYEDGAWEAIKVITDGVLLGLYVTATSLPAQIAVFEATARQILIACVLTFLIAGLPQALRHMIQKRGMDPPTEPQ